MNLPSYSEATQNVLPSLETLPTPLLVRCLMFLSMHELHSITRVVSTKLCSASKHILRETLLSRYQAHVEPLYSTNPSPTSGEIVCETQVLDYFVAAFVHASKLREESDLHLISADQIPQAYPELFKVMQPRARLQDVIRGLPNSLHNATSHCT